MVPPLDLAVDSGAILGSGVARPGGQQGAGGGGADDKLTTNQGLGAAPDKG